MGSLFRSQGTPPSSRRRRQRDSNLNATAPALAVERQEKWRKVSINSLRNGFVTGRCSAEPGSVRSARTIGNHLSAKSSALQLQWTSDSRNSFMSSSPGILLKLDLERALIAHWDSNTRERG